jgi:rhodanese-related sulfurtransferase
MPNLAKGKKEQRMIFLNWLFGPKDKSDPMAITYEQLVDALRDKTYLVVDVREPLEFEEGHIPGAINVPLSRFDPEALPADKQIVLVCQAGARSAAKATPLGISH